MARGKLRIYLGAAPGVGKTFAMLNEGRRRRERGTDVVVGFVETHGRALTAAQIGDLEVVPRRQIDLPGRDVRGDGPRRRPRPRPQVALVDELAHTNVPGSRNEKRWQDVEELLAAGIDVISTVNIQHLESLNDVVERITGIVQRETVPDAVVRAADQIELVDMTPEALRRRMAHGNIYAAEKVDAALAQLLPAGNLGALRELALLWVADRVDEGLEEYRERHGITEPWETRERVVVALTGAPGGEQLIRRGARMAARSHGELVGVHVRDRRRPRERPTRTCSSGTARCSTSSAGATPRSPAPTRPTRSCASPSRERHAARHRARRTRSRWAELTRGSVINRAIRQPGRSTSTSSRPRTATEPPRRGAPDATAGTTCRASPRARRIAWLGALSSASRWSSSPSCRSRTRSASPACCLLLLLAPVAVAMLGGLRPALAASLRRVPARRLVLHRADAQLSGSHTPETRSLWSCSSPSRRW